MMRGFHRLSHPPSHHARPDLMTPGHQGGMVRVLGFLYYLLFEFAGIRLTHSFFSLLFILSVSLPGEMAIVMFS